jgi:hypothetical protein
MHSFSMRPAKYFYDKPLHKYLDPKTVLIYRPHPVCLKIRAQESRIQPPNNNTPLKIQTHREKKE